MKYACYFHSLRSLFAFVLYAKQDNGASNTAGVSKYPTHSYIHVYATHLFSTFMRFVRMRVTACMLLGTIVKYLCDIHTYVYIFVYVVVDGVAGNQLECLCA